ARDLNRSAGWRVAELEVLRVYLVHNSHRNLTGEVGIHEHHVPEVGPGCLERLPHAIERELHLYRRIGRDLPRVNVAPQKTRKIQALACQHSRADWGTRRITHRYDYFLLRQIAHGHRADFERRAGQLGYA